jgi:putative addiction module component (TIGR02574 family)
MTKHASALLADALRLSEAARAELAAELLASLDGPPDGDAHSAWQAEILRRIDAVESGRMPLESWDDVKERVAKGVLKR